VWDQKPIGDVIVREIDGHLALSGSVVAHRYLDNPSRTAQSFVSHEGRRWYVSDDAGFVDEAGLVHVLGRLDDVIISGGVKVALGAIETVVRNTVAAHDAVVVAAPHDQWGHVPVVVTTQELDLATVRQVVHAALGAEARPHRIIVVSEIPLLSSGKPDRLGLTQLAKG
jgi:O-succinylbenzoic acid--CoA ligase